MTLALDIAGNFAAITDNLKSVAVDGNTVQACLRREVSTKEALASGGKYLLSDTVFHLDRAEQADRPAIGGQITDDDGVWTILTVQWQTFVNRWRCVCRQLFIDGTLDQNKVTIQTASFTKGATGAQEPTWADAETDVVARVQLINSDVETTHSDRSIRTAAKVFFTQPRTFTLASRIVTSTGMVLKVLSWDGFSEVDQFFAATCEVSLWPQS